MSNASDQKALDFIQNEKEFHLGFLPTEQSSPLTRHLDEEFRRSTAAGVANLQSVDRNVLAMAKKVFASARFTDLCNTLLAAIRSGHRVAFSGCGATGRLAILLESMWRTGCARHAGAEHYADNVVSIMTGGDFALVRSVEAFEDYQNFGRRQVAELDLREDDVLVAITEGGETSSVLGTVFEAVERKMKVFLLFNNPADLLVERLERSRRAITDPRVTVLDLYCGPMALAGSTRMQATSCEQLVAGAALERTMDQLMGNPTVDYAAEFENVLQDLESDAARKALAEYIDFEAGIYREQGYLTYFAGDYLLDIFTDTTERTPTFMLPPFRKKDDTVSPRPWTFVKHPFLSTEAMWQEELRRPLRCLAWKREDYVAMNAPQNVIDNPPAIATEELVKFQLGCENPEDRIVSKRDAAVLLTTGRSTEEDLRHAFAAVAEKFPRQAELAIGGNPEADYYVPCTPVPGSLELMNHMAVKLALNTISTGIMTVLGRVTGNWMSFVAISNKKLVDRAIRLIAEIGVLNYEDAARELYAGIEEIEQMEWQGKNRPSLVQYVLGKLEKKKSGRDAQLSQTGKSDQKS